MSTLLGGGGVIVVILVVILLTWCCLRGLLQRCFVNMCVICCSGGTGQGGAQGEGADVENQGSGGADQGQGQVVASAPPCASLAAPAMMKGTLARFGGFPKNLDDVLAAHRAKSHRRYMICQGVGHTQQVCPSAEGLM